MPPRKKDPIVKPAKEPAGNSLADEVASALDWLKRHATQFGFHLSYPRVNTNRPKLLRFNWK